MILDDDHNGIFVFPEREIECIENVGTLRVKVSRTCGARGKVKVPYKTVDNTALAGKDYIAKEDFLTFYNNEIEWVWSGYLACFFYYVEFLGPF